MVLLPYFHRAEKIVFSLNQSWLLTPDYNELDEISFCQKKLYCIIIIVENNSLRLWPYDGISAPLIFVQDYNGVYETSFEEYECT
jgi:hypothetical protein